MEHDAEVLPTAQPLHAGSSVVDGIIEDKTAWK